MIIIKIFLFAQSLTEHVIFMFLKTTKQKQKIKEKPFNSLA